MKRAIIRGRNGSKHRCNGLSGLPVDSEAIEFAKLHLRRSRNGARYMRLEALISWPYPRRKPSPRNHSAISKSDFYGTSNLYGPIEFLSGPRNFTTVSWQRKHKCANIC
jgi:hypothetical protein